MKTQLLSILVFLTPALSLATDKPADVSLLTPALKMIAGLAVIIGLLLLFYAASRKGFGFLPKQKEGSIKILETKPLGGKKFLCLVSVRGEEMLLGMCNDRIDCLSKLPSRTDFSKTLEQQIGDEAS